MIEKNYTYCVLLGMTLIAGHAQARPLSMADVLAQAGNGSGYAAANAELEARYAAKDQRQSERGWQLFSSVSSGYYKELVTEDQRNEYTGLSYSIGVRYPLFGTLRRRAEAVRSAEGDIQRGEYERALARAQQRLYLRSAYADWWRAYEENRLCHDVSAAWNKAERTLDERLAGRWIRPSEARLMRSEWTSVRRRCDLQSSMLADMRAMLVSLGVTLKPSDTPAASTIARSPKPLSAWADALDENPRIGQRQVDVDVANANRDQPWYTAVNSEFALSAGREERPFESGPPGYGVTAGITFSAPFDVLDYGTARGKESEARYQAANHALEAERALLVREIGAVLARYRRAVDEYSWRAERRSAIDAIIAEERQRGSLDAGDAAVRIIQAQVDHYNANFAMISAWHGAWLEQSALQLFEDDQSKLAELIGTSQIAWDAPWASMSEVRQKRTWAQGTYIWESEALLSSATQDAQLIALQNAGMGVIHVGLNGVQVAAGAVTHNALAGLIRKAHAKNIQVNLLLGDANWMKPQSRPQLMALINRYRDLPFDGLHLDLEVEQLGWPVPDQRLRDWIATLKDAKAASPWPLAISSHPRWFGEMAERGPCVPCEVDKLGLQAVSLMIYTRNPGRSADAAQAAAKRWPNIAFRLAQSVEPDLPADLSWAGLNAARLSEQSRSWQTQLRKSGVAGIDWQSWSYYPSTP
ncbi:TolC family protein [Pseudomonas matsuisoli]|uniref:Outer membrane protein TolC n=1 Tax=Pseudomonas matsuisoli TaxID=1515666 RepID=A0A917PLU4_9PSED|nr:TolC family protein [Pseudomonas matsuisoli]GGJ83773.1 hypothetical protein GCM10009304_07200 [Pseudomonas matsuisoli]